MIILRILIILLLIWGTIWLIGLLAKWWLLKKVKQFQQQGTEVKTSTQLIQCQYCKTYIASDDIIEYKGKYFCSQEHRKLNEKPDKRDPTG